MEANRRKIEDWFHARGWRPFEFQREAWAAYLAGEEGLIHVPTGMGKTYAAFFGPAMELLGGPRALGLLYLSPLRALSRDLELAMKAPGLDLTIESRTSDTSTYLRARQKTKPPHVLLTTPESFNVMLSAPDARERFAALKGVILDEWHELAGNKRGVQVQLAIARLREWLPGLKVWAVSATVGDLEGLATAAVGEGRPHRIIGSDLRKKVELDALQPLLPFAGHLGLSALDSVAESINWNQSTLLFTQTRSQAERWYQSLAERFPGRPIALHHGSLDRKERERVEAGVREETIRVVVCTSSLDLGVDFSPVERVIQIGSPKSVARLIQRAGRSGHRPDAVARITFVPTHALEWLEYEGLRLALSRGAVEAPRIPHEPLDVLSQHLVTCACGGGFTADAMFSSITRTVSYRALPRLVFDTLLGTLVHGSYSLQAYPAYHKLVVGEDGVYRVENPRIARLHRMNIGTLTSDADVALRLMNRKRIGTVEESFISKLRRGERFVFGGRALELVRIRDGEAWVRAAKSRTRLVPRWMGGRLPYSPLLSRAVRDAIVAPEGEPLRNLLALQARVSVIPRPDELLLELSDSREGQHLFVYPFLGRLQHEGLASILAVRLGGTFAVSVNDVGIELLGPPGIFEGRLRPELLSTEDLELDVERAANLGELRQRHFREVAEISGLVAKRFPGRMKSTRQLQGSSRLLFEVFEKYEPENLFLGQTRREVLEKHFVLDELRENCERLRKARWVIQRVKRFTPFGVPLWAERVSNRLSTETLQERLRRIQASWKA